VIFTTVSNNNVPLGRTVVFLPLNNVPLGIIVVFLPLVHKQKNRFVGARIARRLPSAFRLVGMVRGTPTCGSSSALEEVAMAKDYSNVQEEVRRTLSVCKCKFCHEQMLTLVVLTLVQHMHRLPINETAHKREVCFT
jgi:hypothetical protein